MESALSLLLTALVTEGPESSGVQCAFIELQNMKRQTIDRTRALERNPRGVPDHARFQRVRRIRRPAPTELAASVLPGTCNAANISLH